MKAGTTTTIRASFMALVRKRYKCPLCELAVCGSCFNQKIQLDPVIFTDLPSTHHQPPPLFHFRFNTCLIARARARSQSPR